jgi:hypothetical protein
MLFQKLLLSLLVLLLAVSPALAKPSPPEGFAEMFKSLRAFENALEERQWAEATEKNEDFNKIFVPLLGEFDRSAPRSSQQFREISKQLQQALQSKNAQKVNTSYVNLQRLVLDITDHYDFKIHPAQFLIADYLKEADTAAKAGDWDEVNGELEEINGLYPIVHKHLESRGEPALAARIQAQIELAGKAAERKDMARVIESLRQAEILFSVGRNSGKS